MLIFGARGCEQYLNFGVEKLGVGPKAKRVKESKMKGASCRIIIL